MKNIAPLPDEDTEEASPIQPLSAAEAQRLHERSPQVSAWQVVGAQAGLGLLAAIVAWLWSGRVQVGWSVAYGAFAVALPAAVFARALARRAASGRAGAGFLVWELVKIGLTVALLLAAPRLVPGLSWLGVVAGVIVATKMYGVALAFGRRPRRNGN